MSDSPVGGHGDEHGKGKGIFAIFKGKNGKLYLFGGIAVIGVAFWYFTRSSSASTAATTAASTTGTTASTDPNAAAGTTGSGYGYGWSGDGSGTAGTTTSTTTTNNNYYQNGVVTNPGSAGTGKSWTDTGQKMTLAQLAAKLGISVSAFSGTNRLGNKALSNPNALIAKGAKLDYTSPSTSTTASTVVTSSAAAKTVANKAAANVAVKAPATAVASH